MKIAIAGTGDVAKYLVEELSRAGFDVVVLTRGSSPRPWFDARAATGALALRVTDYSEDSLVGVLADCAGVVSVVQDSTMASAALHLALLAACRRTAGCRRLIPSEYVGDIRQYPEQPAFYTANHVPVREALAAQHDVAWTLVCPGWLADYMVPQQSRYVRDIGAWHPLVYAGDRVRSMDIPGTGDEPITCTAARDVAAAVARLFSLPPDQPWPPVTFLAGEATTWNAVRQKLGLPAPPGDDAVAVRHTPVTQLEAVVAAAASSEDDVLVAEFGLWSTTGSTRVPPNEAAALRASLFPDLHFRTLDELLEAARATPGVIV